MHDDLGPAEPGSQARLSQLPKIHRSLLAMIQDFGLF
jgi:hypothetical protein